MENLLTNLHTFFILKKINFIAVYAHITQQEIFCNHMDFTERNTTHEENTP